MHNKLLAITFIALFSAAAGCGGGNKAEKKTPAPSKMDAGSEGGSKIERVCKKICAGITAKCADSDTKPKAEECVFACIDETDGVLDDATKCLSKAPDCEAATKCRAEFDGDKQEE